MRTSLSKYSVVVVADKGQSVNLACTADTSSARVVAIPFHFRFFWQHSTTVVKEVIKCSSMAMANTGYTNEQMGERFAPCFSRSGARLAGASEAEATTSERRSEGAEQIRFERRSILGPVSRV